MATVVAPEKLTMKDFKPEVAPDWCPGCGDFGVLNALFQACAEIDLPPRDLLVVSGIGCSSNLPGFIRTYGVHSLHGRSLPVATGAALANTDVHVVAVGGDGDGFGIGMGHFIHAMRRNLNLTYIVMDNEIYGLTTGQASPTTTEGHKTKSTPRGNVEKPVQPLALAIVSGATYVARGYSGQPKHLMKLYVDGIRHPGFALIDVFSPCVTFNKVQTYDWFRKRIYKLEETDHNSANFHGAMDKALEWGEKIPIGLLYRNPNPPPSLDEQDPGLQSGGVLVRQPLGMSREQRRKCIEEFM
jgi:2-oxoglutarate ferredoxin oxidoreductase subunit beta